jgi:hypothetical protein
MTYYAATIHRCFPSSREDGTLALIDVTADCGKLFAVYTDIEELLNVIEEYTKLPEGAREVLRNVSEEWWTSEYEHHEIVDDEPWTTIWCIKKMDLSPVIDSIKKRVWKVVSGIEFEVEYAIDHDEEDDK